ncbi:hypothetical protein BSFA1_76000 (plasmid) [Burkholderia sp. SFA1]|nr:hypothetical protein BSFA1_76000 [Burkholderia sp. SFA1]
MWRHSAAHGAAGKIPQATYPETKTRGLQSVFCLSLPMHTREIPALVAVTSRQEQTKLTDNPTDARSLPVEHAVRLRDAFTCSPKK